MMLNPYREHRSIPIADIARFLSRTSHDSVLPNASLQGDGQQLLCFDGKLHRELVHYLTGIAVYDQADGLFDGDTALLAIEQLFFADFARW